MDLRHVRSLDQLKRELSNIGTEEEALDFKVKPSSKPLQMRRRAYAKDIAAMANTYGGTLVVGASHDPKTGAISYPGVTEEEAASDEAVYKDGTFEVCSPRPSFLVRRVALGDDRQILLAHVEASLGQPIGIKHDTDEGFWRFPYRVGWSTDFLTPEQVPLRFDGARRLVVVALREITATNRIVFVSYRRPEGGYMVGDAVVEVINERGGAFGIRIKPFDSHLRSKTIAIPFADVTKVWQKEDGQWAIVLASRLAPEPAVFLADDFTMDYHH